MVTEIAWPNFVAMFLSSAVDPMGPTDVDMDPADDKPADNAVIESPDGMQCDVPETQHTFGNRRWCGRKHSPIDYRTGCRGSGAKVDNGIYEFQQRAATWTGPDRRGKFYGCSTKESLTIFEIAHSHHLPKAIT